MNSQPAAVSEVEREKWRFIAFFLVVDALQIAFVSILTVDSSNLFIVGLDFSRPNPLVSGGMFVAIALVQLVVLYYVALSTIGRPNVLQIWPTTSHSSRWTCRHTRDNIVKWTLELASQSGVEVDRIYLLDSPFPNAFTFSLPFVGTIVVLHNNILSLLNPSEVRAVIAHEVAHIKNRDSVIQILTQMPEFFVQVVYLYIYARILLGVVDALLVSFNPLLAVLRGLVLVGFYALSRMLLYLGTLLVRRASRAAELLADYHAATMLGPTDTVNALLRLGQRIEALYALIEETRWLDSLNETGVMPLTKEEIDVLVLSLGPDELDDRVARVKAPHIFLQNRLRILRDVYGLSLSDDDILRIVRPAAVELVRARVRESSKDAGKKIDWREADRDGDARLSAGELRLLVDALRRDPTKMLFDNESGRNVLVLDHPDFRSRVLFLADVFGI